MAHAKILRNGCAIGAVALALVAGQQALAQDRPDPADTSGSARRAAEDIVVTGSRIRGIAPVGSPTIGVSRADIEQSGQNNAADVLREIPQVVSLGANEALGGSGQDSTANQSRAQGLNIRGLGTRATLVLWNGNRIVGMGGFGNFVDPSTFPTVALDRVEVVADGASAIYGSDAVAGVVNIITRKDFDGVEASARYGLAKGGYDEFNYSIIGGKTWSSGHFTLSYEHSGHSLLLATKRDFVRSDETPFGGSDFRSTFCRPGNLTVTGSTANYPLPAGSGIGLTPAQLAPGAPNRCDLQTLGTILPEQKRDTGMVSFAQTVVPGVEVFADAFITNRSFLNANVPTATVTVASTNPYFVTPIAGRTSVQVAYNFYPEIGYTYTPGYERAKQAVAGVRFSLPHGWHGEVSGTYGRSDDLTNNTEQANATAINAAAALSNPATALNVLGSTFVNNPATLAGLFNGLFVIKGYNILKSGNADLQGALFALPGGDVRLSLGAEYREETNYGILTRGDQNTPIVGAPFLASRDIRSFFGELYVPVLAHSSIPALDTLTLSAAIRTEHYSDVGSTTNPKFGFTWVPVQRISLRGSYGRSFRAPALPEANFMSAGYGININTALADPLSPTGVSNGISLVGGNPDLTPEKASTFTAGIDLTPVSGLRLSGTFYSINYSGQISDLVNPSVLQSPFYAAYVTRNPTPAQIAAYLNFGGSPLPTMGPLPATISFLVDARRHNLGDTKMQGIDFDASYHFATGVGDWTLSATGTYLTKLDVSAAPGAPLIDVRGYINRPSTFRMRDEIGFRRGPFSTQFSANYTAGYLNDLVVTSGVPAYHIRSNTTFDLYLGYSLANITPALKRGRLSLSINNLFDRDPPVADTALGYDPQSASALGRVIALTLDAGF